ncbi:hypothetical protein FZEAL_5334 [Fusarium zealandicum]|uniref:C2H2-type domain-containing protein n=1 Tax=Fusarium zealandicum TaxID=1053134 RepID=A0A8H4UKS0_9HYPO|nr:hypothetical protein FZEAL_5334 [Fusarium zealandicum]
MPHHCAGCHKVYTTRCEKNVHMVRCEVHPDKHHLPNKQCASCLNAEKRADTAARAAAAKKREEAEEDPEPTKGKKQKKINNDAPGLTMDNKPSPTFCRVCDIEFPSSDAWRQHMKSDPHNDKLRSRLTTSKDSLLPGSRAELREAEYTPGDDSVDFDDIESASEEQLVSDFIPENCLFCNKTSDTFDESLAHMASTHTFTVPYQNSLTVNLETVVAYLHLVIYGYHECILCTTRRSTVQGVQQHMTAKGHCRPDTRELEEFYDMPESDCYATDSLVQPDVASLRLPSGKTLGHRSQSLATEPRVFKQTTASSRSHSHLKAPDTTPQIATRNTGDDVIPALQASQLSTGDQRSLRHLSEVELRSVLTATARQMDRSLRAEARATRKLERGRNRVLLRTKYYKTENPVYQAG